MLYGVVAVVFDIWNAVDEREVADEQKPMFVQFLGLVILHPRFQREMKW